MTAATRKKAARKRAFLKRFLPQTLFGRAMLILVTPLILVQIVAVWVFYDRLWDVVARRLAQGVAGDIALVIDSRHFDPRSYGNHAFLQVAGTSTGLGFEFFPGRSLSATDRPVHFRISLINQQLSDALRSAVHRPFRIHHLHGRHAVLVDIQLAEGLLEVLVPIDRLWSSTTYIFLLWMMGTALLTLAVATLFMRNQIRALRRLAVAADAFGKGRDVANFRLEGAAEIRQAATAFLLMRERIQRQISQRTEMLAGVSHDLRTPLTRMKLELEMLGGAEEVEELKSDVAEMERMVEGYLDFARGEGSEQPQVVDLVELLNTAAANARRAGTEISVSAPDEFHLAVRPDAIRRSIANLVGNAARYGRHVWVTALPDSDGVDIMVDDDGPGIPEAQREDAFRPFFRLESSRNPATGGTGLGLTIARDIVRGHGGDLVLEVSPQGGLRARVHLPL
jgi:two-component system osmolarity sensor histidine kinase EnvZ